MVFDKDTNEACLFMLQEDHRGAAQAQDKAILLSHELTHAVKTTDTKWKLIKQNM